VLYDLRAVGGGTRGLEAEKAFFLRRRFFGDLRKNAFSASEAAFFSAISGKLLYAAF